MVALSLPAQTITYEQFGAVGDGVTDDMPAIIAAHDAANEQGLPVRARSGSTYYIAAKARTAIIKTDTDWTGAHFIIEDVEMEGDVHKPVFDVRSYGEPFEVEGLSTLRKGQKKIGIKLPCEALVRVENNDKKIYIRKGLNQNEGTGQKEILLVSRSGRIASNSPVLWDYDKVTSAVAVPVDSKRLVIRGGTFTTVANQQPSTYNYHGRGIVVHRSNVLLEGITHLVTGELDHGAPYSGFIDVQFATGVELRDCTLTAHKTYTTIGSAGKPVQMGSYDLVANSCIGIKWVRCTQTTDIDDRDYWGLFASNFCKDLQMDGCRISRFDAHMGVYGVTLRGCTFGHMGVRFVGAGRARLVDCEVRHRSLIDLRSDYGSSWEGEIIGLRCTLVASAHSKEVTLVRGINNEDHDFGYVCHMPSKVTFKSLLIDDSHIENASYRQPYVFATFDRKADAPGPYPMVCEGSVVLRGVRVLSGRDISVSFDPALYKGYSVRIK